MADALASGASDRKIVGVQVPPRPLFMNVRSPLFHAFQGYIVLNSAHGETTVRQLSNATFRGLS